MNHQTAENIGRVIGYLIVIIPLELFFSICFLKIARKTRTEPQWLAWVPVARMSLLCKCGGIAWWHGVAVCILFLFPKVPVLLVWAYLAWIFYQIPEALEVDSWMEFLMFVPVVNYGYLAYLAFRKETKSYFQPEPIVIEK